MKTSALESTIKALLAHGKGLLAADESFPTIEKRFDEIGLLSSEENRRTYRELLFTTPKLGRFISGAILFDETLRQQTSSGLSMVEVLKRQGIVPGIKVDAGTAALAGSPGEKITQGLDGLRERLASYHALGARFSKWRAVFTVSPTRPSFRAIEANSWALAIFAALSQEAGLVPIVEPEVLMDGSHSFERCEAATTTVLKTVFAALLDQGVLLEAMLLKSEWHGARRDRRTHPSATRENRGGDLALFSSHGAGGRAGDRLSLRRPEQPGRHSTPGRNLPGAEFPLEIELLLWPGAPSASSQKLARSARQKGHRPTSTL